MHKAGACRMSSQTTMRAYCWTAHSSTLPIMGELHFASSPFLRCLRCIGKGTIICCLLCITGLGLVGTKRLAQGILKSPAPSSVPPWLSSATGHAHALTPSFSSSRSTTQPWMTSTSRYVAASGILPHDCEAAYAALECPDHVSALSSI